jgi:hypothetical protein
MNREPEALLHWPQAEKMTSPAPRSNDLRKTYFRRILLGVSAASFLFSTGCRGISTTRTQDIGGPRFAPSDPQQIEILRNVPARPHVELGQVRAYSSDPDEDASKIEDALRKEAARLGADAFVVWHDELQTSDGPADRAGGTRLAKAVHGRTVVGAAIKYP